MNATETHLIFLSKFIFEQEIDGLGFEENTLFGSLNNYYDIFTSFCFYFGSFDATTSADYFYSSEFKAFNILGSSYFGYEKSLSNARQLGLKAPSCTTRLRLLLLIFFILFLISWSLKAWMLELKYYLPVFPDLKGPSPLLMLMLVIIYFYIKTNLRSAAFSESRNHWRSTWIVSTSRDQA